VPEPLRQEITPKNILMIGPTGVGKTEIARRLARLADAPSSRSRRPSSPRSATSPDVDTIVRDLVEMAVKQTRETEMRKVRDRAIDAAEDRVIDVLVPPAREVNFHDMQPADSGTRQKFRKMLREGKLDDKEIEVEVALLPQQMEIMTPPGMEDLTSSCRDVPAARWRRRRTRKMKVREALKVLTRRRPTSRQRRGDQGQGPRCRGAERHRVLDEIDKIASREGTHGADVSRQGVQRDLLPLVEGTTVTTKYGMIRTDHVLFIASGRSTCRSPPT